MKRRMSGIFSLGVFSLLEVDTFAPNYNTRQSVISTATEVKVLSEPGVY